MYQLGKKLRRLRLERGLTLEELAEDINTKYGTTINKGMLSKWENDLSEPKLETARILSLYYKISLDELLGIVEETENDIETIAAHHDGEEWTEEELRDIEAFKEYVRSRRKQREE